MVADMVNFWGRFMLSGPIKCVLSAIVLCNSCAYSQSKKDSLLQVLGEAIGKKEVYVKAKLERIESLRASLRSLPKGSLQQEFSLCNTLYHEYKVFVYDSAFRYVQKMAETARKLDDPQKLNYARLKLGFILVSSGMFKETFDSLKTISVQQLPDSSKIDYYSIMARTYYDLGNYDNDLYYNPSYKVTGSLFLDSARRLCRPGSYEFLYVSNYKNMMLSNNVDAIREVTTLLSTLPLTNHQRAVNNHHLGSLYLARGEPGKALEPFVTAAIADLITATKENAAMNSVADLLYKKGDIDNAYELIEQAMEDALYYGAKQRKVQIGSILPIIAAERLSSVERQRKLWLTYSTVITILGVLILVFVFIIVRQVKKLKKAEQLITQANHSLQEINGKLREADRIKEEYIGYYFNINSDYIDKIEEVKKGIDQKLMARKFDDINYIISNINLKREREELFVGFDKVFLKLFPDFVNKFNSFFRAEDRIVLKDDQLLNTELRIFALIRMGINDTEKIAKILDYSVNTIYTYKTKVKSKSIIPNDEFEQKIMEIDTI